MSEREMQDLVELLERRLGKSWVEIMAWLESQNGLAELEERLATGNIDSVVQGLEDAAKSFAAVTNDAYATAGKTMSQWLDSKVTDKLISFDATNARAVARAQANQLELVQGLVTEQRQVTRNIMIDGAARGTNPRELARDIRQGLGLTETQEGHVRSYRRALESGDYDNALGRELSHGGSDRTIAAAQRKGTALTQDQIDTAVSRYRDNYVTHRATVIARTEALRNANLGAGDAIDQAIRRGDVDADQLTKEWHAGPRTRYSRPDHRAMDGKRVGVLDDFVLPDGTRMQRPGDPKAPVSQTAQCRCTVSVRMLA